MFQGVLFQCIISGMQLWMCINVSSVVYEGPFMIRVLKKKKKNFLTF
jgi:hypothetical protein